MIPGRPNQVGLALLVAAGLFFVTEARVLGQQSGYELRPPERRQVNIPIPDFSLKDQSVRPFSFQKLRGKLVLVTFIYTTCPHVCPLLTLSLLRVQKELRASERNSVFLLSISIDPEIDKPQVLKSYGDRYEVDFSNWSFLTGDIMELAPVWKAFGVKVQKKARGLVDHTALTALVDGNGVMRFAYYGGSPDYKIILRDMRTLLSSQ